MIANICKVGNFNNKVIISILNQPLSENGMVMDSCGYFIDNNEVFSDENHCKKMMVFEDTQKAQSMANFRNAMNFLEIHKKIINRNLFVFKVKFNESPYKIIENEDGISVSFFGNTLSINQLPILSLGYHLNNKEAKKDELGSSAILFFDSKKDAIKFVNSLNNNYVLMCNFMSIKNKIANFFKVKK